jgi:predicted metal-dependent hydrolase
MTERVVSRFPEGIERGLQLFAAGEFFEAHEVMEDVWRRERGKVRMLYQGLIQAAVACHHVRRGNRAGAIKMADAARPKIIAFADARCDLDLPGLAAALGRLGDELRSGRALDAVRLPLPARSK